MSTGSAEFNVAAYLLAGKSPDRPALCSLQADHCYGELQQAVSCVARYLLNGPFDRGDRVALIAQNSLFWVASYLGTLAAGLVSVPVPVGTSAEEIATILGIADPRAAFIDAGVAEKRADLFCDKHVVINRKLPGRGNGHHVEFGRLLADAKGASPLFTLVEPDDLAALMFTSGSTGTPRGVMVTHRNILANTESIIQYLGLTADDRIMDVLPFHYCFGASLLHTHLRIGGTVVMDSRFQYPEAVLKRMQDTRCTGFAGVPSHFQILLRKSNLSRMAFPDLRYIQQAGGALAPAFIRELQSALPRAKVFIMYGQTEATARLSYLPPELLDCKIGSIGRGIPGVLLQVLNDAGQVVAPGELGEVVAQGANIAAGYWQATEDSALSFRDGKLYTGDLATVDGEGFIYIVDRAKDMIKCGGRRVSCRRLEEQILAFDGIKDAAAIGAPDEVLGEAVQLFVAPRGVECNSHCDMRQCRSVRDQVWRFCREHLPPQALPKQIVCLPQLPYSTTGKLLKSQLKAL